MSTSADPAKTTTPTSSSVYSRSVSDNDSGQDAPHGRTPWAWCAATFFGAGLLKPGPGTYGSIAAMLLWLAAGYGLHLSLYAHAAVTAVAAGLAIAIGIPAATVVARESGREDPGHIVIDEVAGQWIALLGMPLGWVPALISLLLFRVLDILKPPPARRLEHLHGGVGIVLDDVAAGLYALIMGQLVQHWKF